MANGRPKLWIWFLLSVVFAVGAAWAAHAYLVAQNATTEVVVAKVTIPPMSMVPPEAVELQARPVNGLPQDAVRRVGDVAGRFTQLGLVKGQVVESSQLLSETAPNGANWNSVWDAKLVALSRKAEASGLTAFPLYLDEKQGYTLVQGGDRVDVLAVSGQGSAGQVAGVVAQQVLVLGKIEQGQNNASITGSFTGGQSASGGATQGVVVLGVDRATAVKLAMAQVSGKVTLVLESPGAKAGGTPASVDGTALFGGQTAGNP